MKFTLQAIGRIGNDATVRPVGENAAIGFSIAVSEKYKNAQGQQLENTYWIDCTIWRKVNETTIAGYLKKGTQVYIEGRPTARPWVNAQNQAMASLDCRVDKLELLGSPQQAAAPQPSAPAPTAQAAPQVHRPVHAQPAATNDPDLPF